MCWLIFILRFGTCGGIASDAVQGTIAVANKGSGYVSRNPDAFKQFYHSESPTTNIDDILPYQFHTLAPADEEFSTLVIKLLGEVIGTEKVIEGMNITADSYYATQARIDPHFQDANDTLLKQIHAQYSDVKAMEMETFQLFHLARCCILPMKVAAAAVIKANRFTAQVIESDVLTQLENVGGKAVMEAVSQIPL